MPSVENQWAICRTVRVSPSSRKSAAPASAKLTAELVAMRPIGWYGRAASVSWNSSVSIPAFQSHTRSANVIRPIAMTSSASPRDTTHNVPVSRPATRCIHSDTPPMTNVAAVIGSMWTLPIDSRVSASKSSVQPASTIVPIAIVVIAHAAVRRAASARGRRVIAMLPATRTPPPRARSCSPSPRTRGGRLPRPAHCCRLRIRWRAERGCQVRRITRAC